MGSSTRNVYDRSRRIIQQGIDDRTILSTGKVMNAK